MNVQAHVATIECKGPGLRTDSPRRQFWLPSAGSPADCFFFTRTNEQRATVPLYVQASGRQHARTACGVRQNSEAGLQIPASIPPTHEDGHGFMAPVRIMQEGGGKGRRQRKRRSGKGAVRRPRRPNQPLI